MVARSVNLSHLPIRAARLSLAGARRSVGSGIMLKSHGIETVAASRTKLRRSYWLLLSM